jgi:hypothetical protein
LPRNILFALLREPDGSPAWLRVAVERTDFRRRLSEGTMPVTRAEQHRTPETGPPEPRRPAGATANPHLPDEGLSVPEDSVQQAGHTSPAESGVSSLDAPERKALSRGWSKGPVIWILLVVAVFAAGALGMAIELIIR